MKSRRKKRTVRAGPILPLILIALVIPACFNWLRQNSALLGLAGERAAMLAAAVNMPEEGIALLRERFEQELYTPPAEAQAPSQPQVHTPYTPGQPAGEQSAPGGESEAADMQGSSEADVKPPKIPKAYQANIINENFAVSEGAGIVRYQAGVIKNDSGHTDKEVENILETTFDLGFSDTVEPQVLIVHTHATEAFERYDTDVYDKRNTWRSRDNNMNMVSVGAAMAQVLEENGIGVLHDTTQHDYPSYNGSYERSATTIKAYLEEYPSIKVVLDLHRDAMERESEAIVKPVCMIDGKKAAQIMIIAACDDDGTLGVPNYKKNLRFAAALQSYIAGAYQDLARPVFFSYRKYNMDLSPGSLLIEFGSNANTLEEAVYSARMAGQALADLIRDNTRGTEEPAADADTDANGAGDAGVDEDVQTTQEEDEAQ